MVDRRDTAAPQLAKYADERFQMDEDLINNPSCTQYDVNTKAIDRWNTAAPQLAK